MASSVPSGPLPAFVSHQVTEARRFFLNLNPARRAALEVVCGGVERMRPDYAVDRRDFPYFAVELVAEGAGEFTMNGQRHVLSAGSVFAYGPGAPHAIRNQADNGMRKYYVDFVGTRAATLLRDTGLSPAPREYAVLPVGGLHELTDVFEMLIRDGGDSGPLAAPICESLTRLLFLKIRQQRLSTGTALPKAYATYERARRYIDANFLRLHTAESVAQGCGITAVYLSRLFGRFSDCGAYQYLLRRKMNYAAGLLMNEGLLVREVAARLEFADPFQFSRSFKRVYGIPPTRLTRPAD